MRATRPALGYGDNFHYGFGKGLRASFSSVGIFRIIGAKSATSTALAASTGFV
jgi:hypothetical protein